ncbi:type II secretion system secretin GspD [Gallaecimonas xiamenensis]|uniref:General secretion pathway protein D n=1 Tax=Gallaecimonas xiamenensis 3-C-1 TaxID=745411 RepID=K2JKW9_9GAMM|nr:type II secretion system secretin GspD [Gallaecimonas xiamenensis]EKE75968.1 general secretion pathway protein D [Gallaecimonas xiamenensis 3-C-1]
MNGSSSIRLTLALVSGLFILSCAWAPGGDHARDNPLRNDSPAPVKKRPSLYDQARTGDGSFRYSDADPNPQVATPVRSELYQGSGQFVNFSNQTAGQPPAEGDVTLNFQGTDISEVVKTVLGDIMQVNYSLDPKVQGAVNLQTSKPIAKDALLPTLETLLQANGAALVENQGIYKVVPLDGAGGSVSPRAKLSANRGYQMLVMPLQYISAKEMAKLLEPIKPKQGIIQADEHRNLLTLAGTQSDLVNLRNTIKVFDVDQMKGMSVGLFRLQAVDPSTLSAELESVFGDKAEGPLAGMLRFVPIERLNALLVITPQSKYLQDARTWVERLDRAENPKSPSMFVYYVQNSKAGRMAEMLNQLFEGQRKNRQDRPQSTRITPAASEGDTSPSVTTSVSGGLDPSSLDVGEVSIIADEENNALVVMATASDYDKVYKAIKRLDVLPLQVLVEATIVEVTLEDELRYGLQWFFTNSIGGKSGRGVLGSGLPLVTPDDFLPSASFEVFDAAGTRVLLNALATDSKVNVVSSPSLMVLDNHTATIRVGDQVPVRTSQTTNTSSDLGNVTSTIQFKDTGVLLEVTPRVNSGGMVVLDILQEVNDVARTTTSDIDSPTITQRRIDTSVAVQSGETLVLGGLIRENKSNDSGGVPGLRHIPVLGWLFGSKGTSNRRTELVVMLTPTAVGSREEAREVTEEYRSKLKGMDFSNL